MSTEAQARPSSFARISIKTASSRDKTPILAWTRTVPRAFAPDFVASRHGFGVKGPTGRAKTRIERDTKLRDAKLELIQWTAAVSSRRSNKNNRRREGRKESFAGGGGGGGGGGASEDSNSTRRAIPAFEAHIGNVLAPGQHLVVMVARARGLPTDCSPVSIVRVRVCMCVCMCVCVCVCVCVRVSLAVLLLLSLWFVERSTRMSVSKL
jgi:hypothetical protein